MLLLRIFRYLVIGLVGTGFLLSLAVHVATYFGIDVFDTCWETQFLHVGIFLCIVPVAIATASFVGSSEERIEKDVPLVLTLALWVLLLYGMVLFFAVPLGIGKRSAGTPRRNPDGTYSLYDRSQFLRPSTPEEYHWFQCRVANHASASWMFFYWFGMLGPIAAIRREARLSEQSVTAVAIKNSKIIEH